MHDDDQRIDEALEALARPDTPARHVDHVLARTGPGDLSDARPTRRGVAHGSRLVATAATLALVALGVVWQRTRTTVTEPASVVATREVPAVTTETAAPTHVPPPAPDLPARAITGAAPSVATPVARRPADRRRLDVASAKTRPVAGPIASSASSPPAAFDETPSLSVTPITAASIDVAPLSPVSAIPLEAIALDPIVIAPVTEENP